MTAPYEPPGLKKSAFNCPYCDAYAQMDWRLLFRSGNGEQGTPMLTAKCSRCSRSTYWIEMVDDSSNFEIVGEMLFPKGSSAPMPHTDMPNEVLGDFVEARNVVGSSPRSAAALLRLAIQKLCISLGEKGKNLDHDIGALVKKGLPVEIQQALDIVRVTGNHSVHPGKLTTEDVAVIAFPLFELVNQIVEDRIARPKKLRELYRQLPADSRDAIERRDESMEARELSDDSTRDD